MPSFNHVTYVAEAIASAAAQTHPRLELVVVDDGSQDGSPQAIATALDWHRDRFERCVFEARSHRGAARALNRCVELARGEYVSVLDSDDVLHPDKISTLLRADAWESPDVAAVFGDAAFIDMDSRPVRLDLELRVAEDGFATELEFYDAARGRAGIRGLGRRDAELASYDSLLHGSFVPDGAAMIRRELLRAVGGFDGRLLASDYDLWVRIARRYRLAFVDAVVASKRWHSGNASVLQQDRAWRDVCVILARERRFCTGPARQATWRPAFGRAVSRLLTYGSRRDLLALFWPRPRVSTAGELWSLVRTSKRERRRRTRVWSPEAWRAEVGLDDEYRLSAQRFLERPVPNLTVRASLGIRHGRLGRYLVAAQTVPGWVQPGEAVALARASRDLRRDATIVEIGSFLGQSSVLLGGGRRVAGSGTLHCVDVFDGSGDAFSVPYYLSVAASLTCSLREYFDAVMHRTGLRELVRVHQGTAEAVVRGWTEPIDMLFMDGDQTPAGTRRAYELWTQHLVPGGVLALHSTTAREKGHDGPARLAETVIRPPDWEDVHRVDTTIFARRAVPRARAEPHDPTSFSLRAE